MPDDGLQHRRHRRLPQAGDLGPRQHRVGEQGDQHHQASHADKAEDRGSADVRALLRITGIDAGALDAEKDEHGDEHRRADLLEQARSRASPRRPRNSRQTDAR